MIPTTALSPPDPSNQSPSTTTSNSSSSSPSSTFNDHLADAANLPASSSSAAMDSLGVALDNIHLSVPSNDVGGMDESMTALLDENNLYRSRLQPQPLYQIYMIQEQEKLRRLQHQQDGSGAVQSRTAAEVPASFNTASSSPCLTTLISPPSTVPPPPPPKVSPSTPTITRRAEDHEADSACDSNERDDISSVSIRRQSSSASTDSGRGADVPSSHATSMRRERLTAGSIYGSQRSLWCELTEVKSAGLLESLDDQSKKLQEAYFEVITSEASYLRSLNFLITHFMAAPELMGAKCTASVITTNERKHLFSNILSIRDCSEQLLCDLESRLQENLLLSDVCDILCDHFEKHFDAYVSYCSNQVYQDRTLKRLKATNSQFTACVQRIEADKQCHGLDVRSFLMLPMQRVTRYPLLVYAILDRVDALSPHHTLAARALILANQVVSNCNEGARKMERTEQLLEIERRLVYKSADLKRIPLITSGRYIVKSGLITQLLERQHKAKLNVLQSKQRARGIYLFLFSDLLLIAKRKMNGTFVCKDYAARRFIVIEPVEPHNHKVPVGAVAALPGKPHLFFCILMQNARGKQVELLLNAESESDRERWLSAMRPPTCADPNEKIYAEWDCPQALAVHTYEAGQEDELSLEKGDLVNILRKLPDGWYYGERTRDNKGGWFPSSYVQPVLNDHVRANNYRHRLRVIQAAAEYRAQQQHHSHSPQNHHSQRLCHEKRACFASTGTMSSPSPLSSASYSSTTAAVAAAMTQVQQPLLVSRLRRLSNPRALFSTAAVGTALLSQQQQGVSRSDSTDTQ